MNFNLLCEKLIEENIRKIKESNIILNEIKKDSGKILEFIDEYVLLLKTYQSFGEEYTSHSFQSYLYDKLIPWLDNKLGAEYSFKYPKNYYPADLSVSYKGYRVVSINIRNKTLKTWNPIDIDRLENVNSLLEIRKLKKEELLEGIIEEGNNPLKIFRNPKDMLLLTLKKREHEDRINHSLFRIKKDIKYYEDEIIKTSSKLEKDKQMKEIVREKTIEITSFFEEYNFNIIDN